MNRRTFLKSSVIVAGAVGIPAFSAISKERVSNEFSGERIVYRYLGHIDPAFRDSAHFELIRWEQIRPGDKIWYLDWDENTDLVGAGYFKAGVLIHDAWACETFSNVSELIAA